MVPASFAAFFSASASASAALLGLLFVSISISPEEKITANADVEKRISAYAALNSLINAFFISLAALLPMPSNFGVPVVIFGVISITITLQNGFELLRSHQSKSSILRRILLTVLNLLTYIAQCYYGFQLINYPKDPSPVSSLTALLLVIYVLGIERAWQLLGGMRRTPITKLIHNHQKADQPDGSTPSATNIPPVAE